MYRTLCLAIALLLVAPAALAASGNAEDVIRLRAWDHSTYGRVVFDAKEPVTYSAKIVDGNLVIEFPRPMPTSLDLILRRLRAYVEDIKSEENGKRVTLKLKNDFALRSFIDNGNAVFDLLEDRTSPAPGPAKVRVRTGEHPTFTRLVFDWPDRVIYRISKKGGTATIRFAKQAAFD
ncbi:MAG: hypothetical protein ACPHIA_04085, partial [Alphaproteobacteria bacterium]